MHLVVKKKKIQNNNRYKNCIWLPGKIQKNKIPTNLENNKLPKRLLWSGNTKHNKIDLA